MSNFSENNFYKISVDYLEKSTGYSTPALQQLALGDKILFVVKRKLFGR